MADAHGSADAVVCLCGASSPGTARFCASCGRPLGSAGAPRSEPAPARVALPEVVEERRLVTALFADLSGFTSLASRLDTEELMAVVDPLIDDLAGIVTRYGGYLEKFAGDALLALFGAPVAHEDDPVRALRAAAEMHVLVAARGARPPDGAESAGLALHIGVNTGPVVARFIESGGRADYAVLGESVILAQRLQSLAPTGQTFVGQLTCELAGVEFDFEPIGPQQLKGRSDPLPVFRVRGSRTSRVRTLRPMIGRNAELGALVAALARARGGQTVIAQLAGPAGSGKSRLLEELRSRAVADGVLTVEIVGASYHRSTFRRLEPLFAAALRARYPRAGSTARALELLDDDPNAPATAQFTSMLMGDTDADLHLGERVAQGVRRELGFAADAWLSDLCARTDVLILVDNRQWLEPSSIDLLDELVAARDDRPLLLCLSGRQSPKPRDSGDVVTIELNPLGVDDVRDLIVEELLAVPDLRLVDYVVTKSSGNPLMARELTRLLRDDGLLDSRLGHVRLVAGAELRSLPTNLRALLAAQIDGLRPGLAQVATAAAAIGLAVPLDLLAQLADGNREGLRQDVDELVDAGFLSWRGGAARNGRRELCFDNPLLRDLLYGRMTGRRRRAMHARIAGTLTESTGRSASTVALEAQHRYLAGDSAGALPLLRTVADQSRQVFAHDDAVLALTRAVEAAGAARPELVPDLLCDLADVRFDLGEYEEAARLCVRAQQAGGDARAWAGQAACQRRLGEFGPAQEVLRHAIDLPAAGETRLLWGELAATRSVSGDLAGSVAAAESGLALGRGDDGVAGRLQSQLVRSLTLLGRLDEARAIAERSIENLRRAGDLAGQCTALRLLGSLEQSSGSLEAAATTLEAGLALAERAGVVEEIGGCLINLGLVRSAQQDHAAAAESYARAAVIFEQTGNRGGQAVAYGNRAWELWQLGDPVAAKAMGHRCLALARETGRPWVAADVEHTLAVIAESEGAPAEALKWATAAVDDFTAAGMPDELVASQQLAHRVLKEISGTRSDR